MAGTGKQQHRHRPSTFRADAPLITCNPHTARARRLGKRGTHLAGLLRQVNRNGPNLLPPATRSTTRPVTPVGRAGRAGGSKFQRICGVLREIVFKALTSGNFFHGDFTAPPSGRPDARANLRARKADDAVRVDPVKTLPMMGVSPGMPAGPTACGSRNFRERFKGALAYSAAPPPHSGRRGSPQPKWASRPLSPRSSDTDRRMSRTASRSTSLPAPISWAMSALTTAAA